MGLEETHLKVQEEGKLCSVLEIQVSSRGYIGFEDLVIGVRKFKSWLHLSEPGKLPECVQDFCDGMPQGRRSAVRKCTGCVPMQ